jgi:hypothetical protein
MDTMPVIGARRKRQPPNPLHSKPFTHFKKIIIWADGEQYDTKIDWVTLEEVAVRNEPRIGNTYQFTAPDGQEERAITYELQDGQRYSFYICVDFINYLCRIRPEVEDHRQQS